MKQTIRRLTVAAGTFGVLALPLVAGAQQPAPRGLPPASATRIITMRRMLDLTPRQLVQLDSIERVQYAARRAQMASMRAMRESTRPDSARGQARMQALRPQMEEMRRRDSVSREAAVRVLNDAQRQTMREVQAEERGRQRGMREARGQGAQRGMRGPHGARPAHGMRPPRVLRRHSAPSLRGTSTR